MLDDLKQYFHQADAKLKDESLYRAWLGKVRLLPASQPLLKPVTARNVLAGAYLGVLRKICVDIPFCLMLTEAIRYSANFDLLLILQNSLLYLLVLLANSSNVNISQPLWI